MWSSMREEEERTWRSASRTMKVTAGSELPSQRDAESGRFIHKQDHTQPEDGGSIMAWTQDLRKEDVGPERGDIRCRSLNEAQ